MPWKSWEEGLIWMLSSKVDTIHHGREGSLSHFIPTEETEREKRSPQLKTSDSGHCCGLASFSRVPPQKFCNLQKWCREVGTTHSNISLLETFPIQSTAYGTTPSCHCLVCCFSYARPGHWTLCHLCFWSVWKAHLLSENFLSWLIHTVIKDCLYFTHSVLIGIIIPRTYSLVRNGVQDHECIFKATVTSGLIFGILYL